ncbi:MAG: hypothetical protein CBE24_03475 [bacterium TMED264]|nr:MAG: hypothetical protein CBE24_03475 [bacterium TMED264]|tara:strand:+ start:17 stop:451 length:435 start_codon:yes stop_codon:yes gene_type:complete
MNLNKLEIKDFDFWISLNTRWIDMDSLGHINSNAYLSYMETGRIDTFIKIGYEGISRDMAESTILASMEVNYMKQLFHPLSLKVGHRIARVGSKSYDLLAGIFTEENNDLACSAYFKLVSFNYKENQTILVPEKIIENCRPVSL